MIDQLEQTAHLVIEVRELGDPSLPPDFQTAARSLSDAEPILTHPKGEDLISGFTLLNDLSGKPAVLIKASMPRPIHAQGELTMRYILFTLVVGGMFFGLAVLVMVDCLAQSWRALRESQARYALAMKGANDGRWDWNVASGQVYCSSRWKSMLGLTKNEVGASIEESFSRIHADDQARVRAEVAKHLNGNGNGSGAESVQTIVTLAQQLGLDVVAEGVETLEQLDRLKSIKCDYGQGYFFSRPLAENRTEALIADLVKGEAQGGQPAPLEGALKSDTPAPKEQVPPDLRTYGPKEKSST